LFLSGHGDESGNTTIVFRYLTLQGDPIVPVRKCLFLKIVSGLTILSFKKVALGFGQRYRRPSVAFNSWTREFMIAYENNNLYTNEGSISAVGNYNSKRKLCESA
jgi:hypothetical protein